MNAEEVKSRVKAVLAENHITANSLANTFGVNQKTLHNQINDSAAIGVSTILLIAQVVPNLSMEWLLRGVGEMYLPSNDNDSHETPTAHLRDTSETPTEYERELKNKDAIIESLQERIAEQKNYIADLRLIANLNMK